MVLKLWKYTCIKKHTYTEKGTVCEVGTQVLLQNSYKIRNKHLLKDLLNLLLGGYQNFFSHDSRVHEVFVLSKAGASI